MIPFHEELLKHRDRTTPVDLSQLTKLIQLRIRHPHLILIELSRLTVRLFVERPQLSCWFSQGNLAEDIYLGLLAKVDQKLFQVALVDTSNRVQVPSTAVIFSQVTSQTFCDVCRTQNQKKSLITFSPRYKLRHKVGNNHSYSGLDVLKGQVFSIGATMDCEFGAFAGCLLKYLDYLIVSIIYCYG